MQWMSLGLDPLWFKWWVLPFLIFFARICDVSLGTIRIIFVARGMRWLAPAVGFFEILIWLLAIGQIMQNINNFYCYLGYAAGFAAGNFIGISIENRLAMGVALIRLITRNGDQDLIEHLREIGCDITRLEAHGLYQPVTMIYTIVKRKDIRKIIEVVKLRNPDTIYTIEDIRSVSPRAFKTQVQCVPRG
jgi:uncharacterized protein YebE (UPF0316 family)